MTLCPEVVIHEGTAHLGSGGCIRSGASPEASAIPRGKQRVGEAGGPSREGGLLLGPRYSLGAWLLPPQALPLPLWLPLPPVGSKGDV